jgi:hypothetical protein
MSFGIFTDKKQHPSEVEIHSTMGESLNLWQSLVADLRQAYPAEEDFKFMYGKNYGWALRFRIKGKLLVNLYPNKDYFCAQVNLSPEAVERALGMNLGPHSHDAIASAHPYPEGRWVFIPVDSEADRQDILRLLRLRVETRL